MLASNPSHGEPAPGTVTEEIVERVARTIFEGVAEAGRWDDQDSETRHRYRKTAEGVLLAMDDVRIEGLQEAGRIAEGFVLSARHLAREGGATERLAIVVETARGICEAIRLRAAKGDLAERL